MPDPKKILIVDDEPDAIDVVEAMLSEVDEFTILRAHDGVAGLETARRELPDLIVLDVQMPEKGGLFVFRDLRTDAATQDIPVIIISGIAAKVGVRFRPQDMDGYLGTGPNAYLDKPLDPVKLQQTVADFLGL